VFEEVIVTRIGPMAFVAMQGEVCAPIGARIKDAFRRNMPIMVFGYMGEHNLYIPTRELVRLKIYQGIAIQIQYASPVGWAPEVEDEMVRGVSNVVKSAIAELPKNRSGTERSTGGSPQGRPLELHALEGFKIQPMAEIVGMVDIVSQHAG
jgi:hypothetical protein